MGVETMGCQEKEEGRRDRGKQETGEKRWAGLSWLVLGVQIATFGIKANDWGSLSHFPDL